MSLQTPIRVLVVEDHNVVRQGLIALIKSVPDMTVVADASNGHEGVELFRRHQPDITLMDLRMPVMNGVDAITAIRRDFSSARIIVLTTYDGDEDIYRALQAGARGYLLKDMFGEELMSAIRAVRNGRMHVPKVIADRLAERMTGPQLTSRELSVLKLIVTGKSNREIAHALGILESTVKTHVNSVLSKLGVNDRTQAATSALQRGIVHLERISEDE
jgi:two-component system NarL family response regulator